MNFSHQCLLHLKHIYKNHPFLKTGKQVILESAWLFSQIKETAKWSLVKMNQSNYEENHEKGSLVVVAMTKRP